MIEQRILEACARAAHEANRAYCIAMGDDSQVPWEEAPDWQKRAAVAGVEGALADHTPEMSHDSWVALKLAEGWSWGATKDPEKKLHPCILPYDMLPPAQRAKDAIFIRVVREVAASLMPSKPDTSKSGETMGLWRYGGIAGGKYLVQRRDGTIPDWPYFVIGAKDPAAPAALLAYASEAEALQLNPTYVHDVRKLADEFALYRVEHGDGDPDAKPHRADDPATIARMKNASGA